MTENLKHSLDSISSSHSPHRPSKISKTTDDLSDDEQQQQQQQQQQPESMSQRPGIQRYLLAIEYIGTRFSGSQQQSNCRTVVGVLEEAFQKFIGQPVSIFCSSRTDAGVHALSNVCHVDVERISKRKPGEVLEPHEPAVVKRAVNHFLQKNEGDVTVIDVRSVPANFHARYKAQERTYFYRLLSGAEPLSTFEKDRAWHVPEELNLRAMQEACKVLVGHHDFSSFRAAGCQVVPYLQIVAFIVGLWGICAPFGTVVRLLVGVLKAVGTGDLKVPDVERILNAKTVTAASPMAPACGLYLGHVNTICPERKTVTLSDVYDGLLRNLKEDV
ncbi:unnamed protein product [Prunus armeniaca]|uniref:tRNA pseudouridine synthase n=1 Tax=Prunus armeniaca TaxID=36596 RepID=A0A6J5TXG8_PRUAR|nr:unnamed protein product [Prunus armeniaca]